MRVLKVCVVEQRRMLHTDGSFADEDFHASSSDEGSPTSGSDSDGSDAGSAASSPAKPKKAKKARETSGSPSPKKVSIRVFRHTR